SVVEFASEFVFRNQFICHHSATERTAFPQILSKDSEPRDADNGPSNARRLWAQSPALVSRSRRAQQRERFYHRSIIAQFALRAKRWEQRCQRRAGCQ